MYDVIYYLGITVAVMLVFILVMSLALRNRLYLLAGMILANLYGLLNLQKRERFV